MDTALRVIQSRKYHQDVARFAIARMTQIDSVVKACWEILPAIFVGRYSVANVVEECHKTYI